MRRSSSSIENQCRSGNITVFETPGVPPNPLPFWSHFPLLQKLPVPSKPPKRTVILHNGRLGQTRWKTEPTLDFDLTDPNLHKYPSTLPYDSRCDVHLRGHMAKHRVQKVLRRQGLVNEDGTIDCSLREYNGYRSYLHELKMKHVKRQREMDEVNLIKQLMKTTIDEVEEIKGGDDELQIQYSGILRKEAKLIIAQNDRKLVEELARQGFTEGELRWQRSLNKMLQEDARKVALLRLRRIQNYGVDQRKRWHDWRRRNVLDMEWLNEEKLKRVDLELERFTHVRQHIKYTERLREALRNRVRKYAEERLQHINKTSREVQRKICIRSHRLWPMSARCPKDVLDGRKKPCHLKTFYEKEDLLDEDDDRFLRDVSAYLSNQDYRFGEGNKKWCKGIPRKVCERPKKARKSGWQLDRRSKNAELSLKYVAAY